MRSSPRRSFPPGRQQTDVVSEMPLPQPQSRPSRRRVLLVCCLIAGSGLALVIAGSFLPWVISGEVRRSSYAILGIVNRLGVAGDGALGVLIANWPLVGVLCMAPVVIACLRWWRTAGVLAVLVALATGLLSFGILIAARSSTALSLTDARTAPCSRAPRATFPSRARSRATWPSSWTATGAGRSSGCCRGWPAIARVSTRCAASCGRASSAGSSS